MHIFEESLNRFIKNSWIYYEANDPYYAGKIERISIEKVHDRILYYEVKAIIQTRWNEEMINFRVNEYGTILTTNCTCSQETHKGCVHLVSVVRAINAINPQTFPFCVEYQQYIEEKKRQDAETQQQQKVEEELKNTATQYFFNVGERVFHDKLGVGQIADVIQIGDSTMYTIDFGKMGKKAMDAAYAHLKKF